MNTKIERMDISFCETLKKIAALRVAKGLDKHSSPQRVQRKLNKHPLFLSQIKKDLENWKFEREPDDKRGQLESPIFSLFVFMISAFLVVILIAGLMYSMNMVNDILHTVGAANEVNAGRPAYTNMTYAADITFGALNNATKGMPLVSIAIIFSLMIGIFISSFFLRVHPAFFFLYVLLTVLGVIFSVPISNAYQTLLQSDIFDGYLLQQPMGNWILINLPLVVCIVGIFSAIFLLINIIRSETEGGPL